jgi:hypothetical protein
MFLGALRASTRLAQTFTWLSDLSRSPHGPCPVLVEDPLCHFRQPTQQGLLGNFRYKFKAEYPTAWFLHAPGSAKVAQLRTTGTSLQALAEVCNTPSVQELSNRSRLR